MKIVGSDGEQQGRREPKPEKPRVAEGRSVRFFQSHADVFGTTHGWAQPRSYQLVDTGQNYVLYSKKMKSFYKYVSCTWHEGQFRIEAWVVPDSRIAPGLNGKDLRLESGTGFPGWTEVARKEANSLLRTLGVEQIGKIKGFYWR
ncbi:MAG: hypothetical protein ACYC99_11815 [Candidatus Geothermincolia bacterium]